MANKDYIQRIVVSNDASADYASLNAAIAAIGTIKTFWVLSSVALTANITMPSGVTLIIGPQGGLTGSYTLTGSNTNLIIEKEFGAFSTAVQFAGTWNIDAVYPENHGAVGDDSTDDYTALMRAAGLAMASRTKTLVLTKTYYSGTTLTWTSSIHLDCKPGMHIRGLTASQYTDTLIVSGTGPGTYYNLTANATMGRNFITCSNSTLLASLSKGDFIAIKSSKAFVSTYPDFKQGEMHKVLSISGSIIYLEVPLYDTYLTSDTAQVAKVGMISFSNSGLLKLKINDTAYGVGGLDLHYCKDVTANADLEGYTTGAINLAGCYEPRLVVNSHRVLFDGLGYGIAVSQLTMRASITGNFMGHRVGVNATGSLLGMSWDTLVFNSKASINVSDHGCGYLTHECCGSITLLNCDAYGLDPDDVKYVGYSIQARHNRIIDCRVHDMNCGINITGNTPNKEYDIINFTGYNCHKGFEGSLSSPIRRLNVKGFTINNINVLAGYAFYMNAANIENWSFDNIDLYNITSGFSIPTTVLNEGSYPESLVVNNYSHKCASGGGNIVEIYHPDIKEVILNGVHQENCGSIVVANSASLLEMVGINNALIKGTNVVKINDFYNNLPLFRMTDSAIKDPITYPTKLLYSLSGVGTVALSGVHTEGSNMSYLTDVYSGGFTNFSEVGCDFVGLVAYHKVTQPSNIGLSFPETQALKIHKSLTWSPTTISSGTLALNNDSNALVLCAYNGNAKHIDLPSSPEVGKLFWVINDGSVTAVLDGNGKSIINGGGLYSSINITANRSVSVIYTGRVWYVTEGHIY